MRSSDISAVEHDRRDLAELLTRHPSLPVDPALAENFFDNNYRVLVAFIDGTPIGCVWWTDRQAKSPERQHPHIRRYEVQLGEKEAWGFSLDIVPGERGDGRANDFFLLFRTKLYQLGYTVLWGSAQKDNISAMWLHRMQGFEEIKTIRSRLFLGTFLYAETGFGQWFVRNRHSHDQQFDYRPLGRSKHDAMHKSGSDYPSE